MNDITQEELNNFIEILIKKNELYKEEVDTINIFNIFLNKKREIIEVKKTKAILDNPILKKEQIIYMYKMYSKHMEDKYKLIKILSYKFDANIEDIHSILNQEFDCSQYIEKHTIINDISWNDTIQMFHSLNSLYFIYQEKDIPNLYNETRKNKKHFNNTTRKKLIIY